ncbi:MAG: DUF1080 domain-containing protein [Verrucomicrobiota bacterium]
MRREKARSWIFTKATAQNRSRQSGSTSGSATRCRRRQRSKLKWLIWSGPGILILTRSAAVSSRPAAARPHSTKIPSVSADPRDAAGASHVLRTQPWSLDIFQPWTVRKLLPEGDLKIARQFTAGFEFTVAYCKTIPGEHGADLVSKEQYDNFELALEWRISPGGNSGIMYHVTESFDEPWHTCPEMQVVDDDKHADGKDPETSAGSLYALIAPTNKKLKPVDDWNQVCTRQSVRKFERTGTCRPAAECNSALHRTTNLCLAELARTILFRHRLKPIRANGRSGARSPHADRVPFGAAFPNPGTP